MDLYERLGVRRGAGAAEIRRAWQRAVARPAPGPQPGRPGRRRALPRGGAGVRGALRPAAPRRLRPRRAARGAGGAGRRRAASRASTSRPACASRPWASARSSTRPCGPAAGRAAARAARTSSRRPASASRSRWRAPTRRVHLVRFEPCAACRRRGRGGLRARALPALPGQRHRARQPRPHDLLAPAAPSAAATGEIRRRALRALRRRGAGDRERVARGADPARRRERQPGAPAGRRQRRPPRRAARRLRPHRRGGGAPALPARGRRPPLRRARWAWSRPRWAGTSRSRPRTGR